MSPLYAKLGCHTLMSKVFIQVTLQRLRGMVGPGVYTLNHMVHVKPRSKYFFLKNKE
jgi:hypothetical protein